MSNPNPIQAKPARASAQGALPIDRVATKDSTRGLRARPPSEGQRIIGVDAAANLLGISPAYLYRLLRKGEIPVVRIGGRTLIAVAAIDKFIAARSGAFLTGGA